MGFPPRCNQYPPLEEDANDDQGSANPPSLSDWDIREAFLEMSQAITTQAQAGNIQTQAMTTKANQKMVPRVSQHVSTMASRLRDLTRMNPLLSMGPK